ncbi:DMT family transporter [Albibacillus kandeliae]|uniref:DMT family transporter n=1 Tax=Albibacillus kandeliae TaxID=2174228 RepID=UPI0022B7F687|nr:DMT family transporter [Albibacillus kandeliae]
MTSTTDSTPANTPTLRAALWMIGAVVSFSSMAVAGREAAGTLDTFEIMTYRSLIGCVIVCAVLTATRKWSVVRLTHLRTHIFRNAAHFAGQNLWLYAVAVAPLAQVFALEFTSPLWVLVLSPLILGERLTRVRGLCALLGFIGILIVARPSPDTIGPGVITAATAAICFAFTMMLTKKLTRTETIGGIMFWLTLLQLIMGAVIAGYDGDFALPGPMLPHVIVIAIGGLLAHFCITNALSLAPASVVMPFDFARLPTIAIVGMLLYSEPLDIWVLVGAAIIFGANYANILNETRRNRVA